MQKIIIKRCKSNIEKSSIKGYSTCVDKNLNFYDMKIRANGNIIIRDNFHPGSECLIITSTHDSEGEAISSDYMKIDKDALIENNVWFGCRIIILSGCNYGRRYNDSSR